MDNSSTHNDNANHCDNNRINIDNSNRDDHHHNEGSRKHQPRKEFIEWARERLRNGELITMPDFARTFEYYISSDAHAAFFNTLTCSTLPLKPKEGALEMYNTWQRNHGDAFWASRSAMKKIETSTKRAVGEIVEGSDRIRKRMISQFVSQVVSDCDMDSDSEKQVISNGSTAPPSSPSQFHLAQQKLPLASTTSLDPDAPIRQGAPYIRKKQHKLGNSFGEKGRRSFGERFEALGNKWILRSGTVVENVLYLAGSRVGCETYSAFHSFMLDLDDPSVEKLFSEDDWKEIIDGLPSQTPYSEAADLYMDSFHDVKNIEDLEKALKERPTDTECLIIYHCLGQWLDLYKAVNPSPFSIVNTLGEAWWINNAWGACMKLANGLPHAFILPGEKTGHDSAERKNRSITSVDRRRIGCKADLIWRTISAPERDWAVAEAAPDWDPIGKKYRYEGTFKLPRQLHDILSARSHEVGDKNHLRGEFVTGLIIGGPVVQRVLLCWGSQGDNVTRLLRSRERRISSSVAQLMDSIWAIHELLLFRASTIRFQKSFERVNDQVAEEKRQARRKEGRSSSVSLT
ncbi:hypothetical protein BG004_008499, partial [Podila humilis]